MIYQLLDYYTVVINNQSIKYCFEKLCIYDEGMQQLIAGGMSKIIKYDKKYKFCVNDIRFEISQDDMERIFDCVENNYFLLIEESFDSIRIEISGSGLEWLRTRSDITGLYPDVDFHNPEFWGDPTMHHITRCDFAFDFINVYGDVLENIINWMINETRDPNGYLDISKNRLRTMDRCGSSYKIHNGTDIKCLYIGSSASNIMLRIYDKKIERETKAKRGKVSKEEIYPKYYLDNENNNIDSWIRFELQTRDARAQTLLYQPGDVIEVINTKLDINHQFVSAEEYGYFDYVLRFIFQKYMIYDREYKPLPFLVDVYNWSNLPKLCKIPVLYNKENKTKFERSYTNIFERCICQVIGLMAIMSPDGFVDEVKEKLRQIELCDTETAQAKSRKIRNTIYEMQIDKNMKFDDLAIKIVNGVELRFK